MKRPKLYSFFFHYNKPLSQQRGKNVLSVHFRDTCHFVESLQCNVPVGSKIVLVEVIDVGYCIDVG